MEPDRAGSPKSGLGPRIVFGLVMLVAMALLAEGVLRLAGLRVASDPYLDLGLQPSFLGETEVDGLPHYQLTHKDTYAARKTSFPVEKPEGTFRVFCLGGSASAGWPHPPKQNYCQYLGRALELALPGRRVEAINASAHAYSSLRVRMIFEELLELEPDLFVVYSGNNEFLEPRRYRPEAAEAPLDDDLLSRSYLARLVRSAWTRFFEPERWLSGDSRDDQTYSYYSRLARVALALRRDPAQYAAVRNHYAYNIESMVRAAGERGVPVVLATVPVNLRDWKPNVSLQSLEGPELEEWQERLDAGNRSLLEEDWKAAIQHLRRATELDPSSADAHFRLARALEGGGDRTAATRHYVQAMDLDHNPFRAPSTLRPVLERVALAHDNATLADAQEAFAASSGGAPDRKSVV